MLVLGLFFRIVYYNSPKDFDSYGDYNNSCGGYEIVQSSYWINRQIG